MNVIAEASDWIAVEKPPALVSEVTPDGQGLGSLIAQRNNGYVGVIHRLDRGVGGVILYAKTPACAAKLSAAAQAHLLQKRYLAVVEGELTEAGELRDLLYFDRARNKSFPVQRPRKGVKEAVLRYRPLHCIPSPATGTPLTLVEVEPVTGRTHQIRVQFASRGLPLLGDRRYGGSAGESIALVCHRIRLPATVSPQQEELVFSPVGAPWDWFL